MRKSTIGEYVAKAIQHAVYEYCDETKSWCGYIRELAGCWAQGNTIEETRLQLIDVIEGWLILALQFDDAIPQLDGLTRVPNPHDSKEVGIPIIRETLNQLGISEEQWNEL